MEVGLKLIELLEFRSYFSLFPSRFSIKNCLKSGKHIVSGTKSKQNISSNINVQGSDPSFTKSSKVCTKQARFLDWNPIEEGELNPKIDFSSFEHLGIVEQLYEGFLSC